MFLFNAVHDLLELRLELLRVVTLTRISFKKNIFAQPAYLQFGFAVLFNTAIAVLLSLLINGACFWNSLLVSQCIGLTIFFTFVIFNQFADLRGWIIVIPLTIGAVLGVLLGMMAAGLVNGEQLNSIGAVLATHTDQILVNLFLAFFFGIIIMYFYITRERHFHASNALKEVQIKNLDHKKQIAETQLQLLQAQIEPHFLFNSLSNVISLIENDPERATLMLQSLTRYLRSSLSRSHEQDGTLNDELDLIENYLKIIQIRMGPRLSYQINIPDKLRQHPFPIMLLQPLVENAIHHGLEPMAEGGQIIIEFQYVDNVLKITVTDNGAGFKDENLSGYGLYNVRQRLQSLFAEAGKLTLENNIPQGVRAIIEIPYA